jgi:4-amino-4-deoxy-L-arabinose transferase-like glycosyltransferase
MARKQKAQPAGNAGQALDKAVTRRTAQWPLVRWLRALRLPYAQIAFWVCVVAVLAVRFWNLDRLQAEVFGDISTARIYVYDVVTGRWPFYIPLSTGPLFHYVFGAVTLFAGLDYFGLKLASVLVSIGTLAFTYLFARRLLGALFATLATFIAGISFWFLVHSRLGNVPIGVPLLVMASLWLLLRYVQERKRSDLYWSAGVATLGLYTYAASYILPAAEVATLAGLQLTGFRVKISRWLKMIALMLVLTLPFVWIVTQNSAAFGSSGYLGGKLQFTAEALAQLGRNVINAFTAYIWHGDMINRVNPAGRAHLDAVSGVLFLLGVWFWLQRERRREGLVILVPFILLHVPSMLVVASSQEVPSSTRTVGAAPLAYVLVASGLWQLAAWLRPRAGRIAAGALSLLLVTLIAGLNLKLYFVDYIRGLPYQNTPIARYITDFFDLMPEETQVYLVGCCWEQSMPEPIGIQDEIERPGNFHYIQPEDLHCEGLDAVLSGPAVVVWNYRNELPSPNVEACAERFPALLYASPGGLPMFYAASVQGLRSLVVEEGENVQWIEVSGRLMLARYSQLDTGRIEDAFDGNFITLMRGKSANPFVLELEFDEPQALTRIDVTVAALRTFSVRVQASYVDGSQAEWSEEYIDLPADATIGLRPPAGELAVQLVRVEISDPSPQPADGYHVHVREVVLVFAD